MNCSNCGADNKDGAKFCKKCGNILTDRTAVNESFEQHSKNERKSIKMWILIIAVILIALLTFTAVVYFVVFDGSTDNIPFIGGGNSTTEETKTSDENDEEPTDEKLMTEMTSESATDATVISSAQTAAVPDVVGLKYSDAYEKLTALHIKFKTVNQYSDTVAKDYIISQYPTYGKYISEGDKVILYVSTGTDIETTHSVNSNLSDYIIDGSNSRYIEKSEVTALSKTEMELALNELYARHDRIFTTKSIADYFNSKLWYHGTVKPEDFSESVFNKYEKANRDLIVEVMEEKGYR